MHNSGIMQHVENSPFPLMYCTKPDEDLKEIRLLYKKIINRDPITIAGFIEFMTRLDRSSTIQSNQSQTIVETQGDGGAFGLGFG